ncbi:MAG: GNAT family N-acetyltransferase [Clostridiales bacterium]|nr:GNAT family N-acetyltransferase [Clostridiales bacterium]
MMPVMEGDSILKTPRIETKRLFLREVKESDVKAIFDCWMQDEEVSRYMWWKASNEIAEAQAFVDFEITQLENDRWNRFIIVQKETKEIIGTCLVFMNEEDTESHWDISYNLGRKYWGMHCRKSGMSYVILKKIGLERMR